MEGHHGFNIIQRYTKTLELKFGRFFYETKLDKSPKPEDLIVKYIAGQKGNVAIEDPSPKFGSVYGFINWFDKEHGKDADLRWNKIRN